MSGDGDKQAVPPTVVWPPEGYKNEAGEQIKSGLFDLTEKEMPGLRNLRKEFEGFEFTDRFRMTDEDLILRFYIASKFDEKKAGEMIRANMKWRVDEDVERVFEWSAENIPKDVVQNTHTDGVIGFYGHDRDGRPVWWERLNETGVKSYLKELDEASCLRWHTCCMERIRQHCKHVGADRVTMVIDASGMSCASVAWGPVSTMLKLQSAQDQAMFPELLYKLLIVNAPFGAGSVYKLIRPFLDARVQQKIYIDGKRYSNDPLDKFVSPENVPTSFGGKAEVDWDTCRMVPSADTHIFKHPCYEKIPTSPSAA